MEVTIEPGAREPEHTHQAPSVMIIDEAAPIRYYQGGTLLFEFPQPRPGVRVSWMEPEGPHSVENSRSSWIGRDWRSDGQSLA